MMKNSSFFSTEKTMRHSTPMSFFGAPSCAQSNNAVISCNTVLSVLLFLLSLVVLIIPALILLPVILSAVIIILKRKQNTASYYMRKD